MSDDLIERIHHTNVRAYRRELALAPVGLRRAKLLTLIARETAAAREQGWSATAD